MNLTPPTTMNFVDPDRSEKTPTRGFEREKRRGEVRCQELERIGEKRKREEEVADKTRPLEPMRELLG